MGVSTIKVATISLFLIIGMALAGLFMQPNGSQQVWDIKESDFPINGSSEENLVFLLNYAILAPSIHNSQPWKFNISDDKIMLFADESRWLQISDADKRELYMSLGCALENLVIAAEHFGYNCQVECFPDDEDLVAVIRLSLGQKAIANSHLFNAITSQKSNDGPYLDRIISAADLVRLQNMSQDQDGQILLTSDSKIMTGFRDLVVQSDEIQYGDANFKSELGHWIGQGMMGPTGVRALMAQMFVVFLDAGPEQIRKDLELLDSTPALGFIITKEDDKKSFVIAGRAFQRLWLAATDLGLALQPMSQPLQVEETKSDLNRLLSIESGNVQQAFRLGYAKDDENERTMRRPIEDVLVRIE